MSIISSAKEMVTDVFTLWSTPKKGNYVAYKEILAYGIGGIGLHFAIVIIGAMTLTVGNVFFGDTVGISPQDIQYMNIISTVLNFGITAFRAHVFDNTRSKSGKFRPFLKTMGIPTVVLSILMVWMPYERMTYGQKFITILVFYQLLQIFFPFYKEAYDNLARVMSPSSQERTSIISIGSVLWSFAPSVYNLFIPVLTDVFNFEMASFETYRFIYPPFAIFGVFLAYLAYKGTKERIVQAKTHFNKVKFSTSLKAVAKNKNFWIISIAGWIGFLEGAAGVILFWQFNYGKIGSNSLYGLVNTVLGFASLPAMLFTPIFTKYIGKKKLLIGINLLNILFLAALYQSFTVLWTLVIFLFINKFVSTIGDTIFPAINADIRDEQQYISGERIDGMFSIVGLFGSIIGMFTGLVLPQIYKSRGFFGNYSDLYNDGLRNDLIEVLIIASVIGAILNVLPYFFYNLTEAKQRGIIRVLKIRAMFEDYGNGVLADSALVEGVDIIRQSIIDHNSQPNPIDKKLPLRERNEQRIRNEDIENSYYVIDELDKFSSPHMQEMLRLSKKVFNEGLLGLYDFDVEILHRAKAAKAETKEEKKLQKDVLEHYRDLYTACRMINKYYPDFDIYEPDYAKLDKLDDLPEDTKEEFKEKKAVIKSAQKELARFHKCAQPYINARKLITQAENYKHLDDIYSKYDEAKIRAELAEKEAYERAKKEKAEIKAESERLRQERKTARVKK